MRRVKIPDGIPDYKPVITERAKERANLPRKVKLGVQMIPIGRFQILEQRWETQESCFSR
jgi:hypothetical protein